MGRFKMDFVAMDVICTTNSNFVINGFGNSHRLVPFKGTTLDDNGRLVGKVLSYNKSRAYVVRFSPDGETYLISLSDCKGVVQNSVLFPAQNTTVAYTVWKDGERVRAWIAPPKRRRLGLGEYSARVDQNGKSLYGIVKQDENLKLYFVPNRGVNVD